MLKGEGATAVNSYVPTFNVDEEDELSPREVEKEFSKEWRDTHTEDETGKPTALGHHSRLSAPSTLDQTRDITPLKEKKPSGLSRLSEILKKALNEQFQHGKRD